MKKEKKKLCEWHSRDFDKNETLCDLCGKPYEWHVKYLKRKKNAI